VVFSWRHAGPRSFVTRRARRRHRRDHPVNVDPRRCRFPWIRACFRGGSWLPAVERPARESAARGERGPRRAGRSARLAERMPTDASTARGESGDVAHLGGATGRESSERSESAPARLGLDVPQASVELGTSEPERARVRTELSLERRTDARHARLGAARPLVPRSFRHATVGQARTVGLHQVDDRFVIRDERRRRRPGDGNGLFAWPGA
jgi:hypothetical protein